LTPRFPIICCAASSGWDGFVTRLGRATFFDNLATFPVSYVDEHLTVFRFAASRVFPPLPLLDHPANAFSIPAS